MMKLGACLFLKSFCSLEYYQLGCDDHSRGANHYYRLLGKVLNEIRKNDETKWIWNKARIELNELAKKVERDLAEYNAEGTSGALVLDIDLVCDACKWLVGGLCSGAVSGGCWKGCTFLCTRIPHPIGAVACLGICLTACEFLLAYEACNMASEEVCRRVNLC